MKRYLIFAVIGPFIGGLLMLFATTVAVGVLDGHQLVGDRKIRRRVRQDTAIQLSVRHRAGADDWRDRRYSLARQAHSPRLRMLIVGAIGFAASALLYGSRGPDTGALQFFLYGIVGMVPTMISSWLAHKYADELEPVRST